MTRFVLAVAVAGSLCGCGVPVAYIAAIGGVLTGTAAVTNADVSAAEAYCKWRGGCGAAPAK